MSFYEYNQYQTQWSECYYNNQYTLSTQEPFMDYVEPCDAAVVPTLSPGLQNIQNYYYYQYNSPASNQETYQYENQNHNLYYYQNHLKNTNNQKQNCAKDFKKVTTSSNLKGITKPKRYRTVFKIEQVEALEMFYKHKQFVNQKERHQLQEILKLNDRTIKVWFQNRRLKDKKEVKNNKRTEKDKFIEDPDFSQMKNNMNVDANVIQEIDRLTEELQQKKEKHELDDFLLSVITNTSEEKKNTIEDVKEETRHIFYEPISPAEPCEEKEVSELNIFDPKELLKTFLNFQD